jgi:hypothetical protein
MVSGAVIDSPDCGVVAGPNSLTQHLSTDLNQAIDVDNNAVRRPAKIIFRQP